MVQQITTLSYRFLKWCGSLHAMHSGGATRAEQDEQHAFWEHQTQLANVADNVGQFCLFENVSIITFNTRVCRYMVKVSDEHLTTIQLCTSKPDVRLKLSVLDNDEEIASAEGKGHAVLPVFIFLPNPLPEDDTTAQSTSQSCK